MEWSDEGIVLSARPHGEANVIATLMTAGHGRHAGMVRGGGSRAMRGTLQPGNHLSCTWRARLHEHLGTYSCELVHGHAAHQLDDPLRLEAMLSACQLVEAAAPERAPAPDIFHALAELLERLGGDGWLPEFVRWELGMLAELGFGLDLSACAATGGNDDLAYVSPRSGRAVSLAAGEPYREKLLVLPGFLIGKRELAPDVQEALAGLRLTGHFLQRHVLVPMNRALPPARDRLVQRLRGLSGAQDERQAG